MAYMLSYNMKSMYPCSYHYNGPMTAYALDVIYFPFLALVSFEQSNPVQYLTDQL